MIKKIILNTFVYTVAPYIPSIASFIILPIITKDLSPIDYGISGTISAYIGAIGALGNLGLSSILNNSFFKYPNHYKYIWKQIYGFLSIWNIFYSIILASLLFFLMPQEAENNKYLIILLNVVPIIFFGQTNTISIIYFTLKKQAFQIGVRVAIFGLLAVFLNLLFISYFKLGYLGWFYTTFIVGILTNSSYWYFLNFKLNITPTLKFKIKTIIKYLKTSLPIIPSHYAYYLLDGSERLIMDRLNVSIGNIGKYNMAVSFGNIVGSITNASSSALVPYILDSIKNKNYLLTRKYIWSWGFILLTFTSLFSLWSKEVFNLLINNKILKETYPLAIILIMAYNFRPLYIGAYQNLIFSEKTSSLWFVSFLSGTLTVVLNLICIPIFGFQIAVYSSFFSYLFWGISLYYTKNYKKIQNVNYHPILWSSLVIVTTFAIYSCKDILPVLKLIISFIILIIFNAIIINYYEINVLSIFTKFKKR